MSRNSRTTPAETVPDAADQRTGEPFADPTEPADSDGGTAEGENTEPPTEDAPVQEDVVEGDRPATVVQEAPTLEGDHYQAGYIGTLPDADNRPDLTLAGVLGLSSAPVAGEKPEAE